MKLLHVTRENIFGGGEQQILKSYNKLQARGFEQLIVCLENSPLHNHCDKNSYNFVTIKHRHNFSVLNAWKLYKIACSFAPDLINIHDYKSLNHMVMSNLLFPKKFDYIITRRLAYNVRETFINNLKYVNKYLKKIVCVSEASKKSLDTVLKKPNIASVIYEGINIEKYCFEHKKNNNTVNIINIGRLSPEKNQIGFIEIADVLINKYKIEANFIIAGDGEQRDVLQEKINSKNLKDKVKLVGYVNNIPKLLASADILIVTSFFEACCLSILEAMCSKVAVIATRVGGNPELCKHQIDSFLYSIDKPEQAAKYIKNLIEDHSLMEKITEKAFQKVKYFDEENMIDKTIQIYKQIALANNC